MIDPGGEAQKLINYIVSNGLKPHQILLTHGHVDHISATPELKKKYDIPVLVHSADKHLLENAAETANFFDIIMENVTGADFLDNKSVITLDSDIHIIHTPGHTPGSVCFYIASMKTIITGDTLFKNAIGRTDLPGGDTNTIINSISTKIYILDDDVQVLAGHGEKTTVGYEKKFNPFVRGTDNVTYYQ
jgi:glyoxylase-like metal-dependent hydrolase (beta-lactamase superfamily II)